MGRKNRGCDADEQQQDQSLDLPPANGFGPTVKTLCIVHLTRDGEQVVIPPGEEVPEEAFTPTELVTLRIHGAIGSVVGDEE